MENWVTILKTVGEKEMEVVIGTGMETVTVLVMGTMVEMEMEVAMITGLEMKLGETKDASVVEAMNIS